MHLFVTGTDTGIGKTVVSSLLCRKLNRRYWKPIQSGSPTDSEWVAKHIGKERVLPEVYSFSRPLSPHLAASIDGGHIYSQKILDVARANTDPLIIEGAGGLLVPLNEKELMIDLISALQCPCVLVARSTLGTINHTLMSLSVLRSRQVEILGVIMVGPINSDNKTAIETYGQTRVIAEIPWLSPFDVSKIKIEVELESQFNA